MSAVVEGEPLTGEVVAEQPECGFNVLDFSDSYYEDKDAVAISFRIVVREKFMWIWIGDAPMLTNSSVHVSNAPTGVSTTRLIEEDEHGDFGTLLGGRLSKKLSNHIVHVNYALTPAHLQDHNLCSMMERTLVKEIKGAGFFDAKRP